MHKRLKLAGILAPLTAPLAILAYVAMSARDLSVLLAPSMPMMMIVSLVFSYAGLALVARIAIKLQRRIDAPAVLTLTVVGALSGALVFWLFIFLFLLWLGAWPSAFDFEATAMGAILGASVALVFGLIAGHDALEGRQKGMSK
ncbi:MAG: hypothetical protein ACR2QL_04330 [Woeseiaceae bacterium]